MPEHSTTSGSLEARRLLRGEEGGAYVEYIILVGVFGLTLAGTMLVLGDPLLRFFRHAQLIWAGPFP